MTHMKQDDRIGRWGPNGRPWKLCPIEHSKCKMQSNSSIENPVLAQDQAGVGGYLGA